MTSNNIPPGCPETAEDPGEKGGLCQYDTREQELWNMPAVADRIRKLLNDSNKTVKDLAAETGINPAQIYRWISPKGRDSVLAIQSSKQLGSVFGVSPDIFRYKTPPVSSESLTIEARGAAVYSSVSEKIILDRVLCIDTVRKVYAVMHNAMMLNAAAPDLSIPIGTVVAVSRLGNIPVDELLGLTVMQTNGKNRKFGVLEYSEEQGCLIGRPLNPAFPPFRIIPEQVAGWVSEVIIRKNYGLADTGKIRLFASMEDRANITEDDGELSPEEAENGG